MRSGPVNARFHEEFFLFHRHEIVVVKPRIRRLVALVEPSPRTVLLFDALFSPSIIQIVLQLITLNMAGQ